MTDQPQPTSHCKVMLAGTIAKSFTDEIRSGIASLPTPPLLVGFLATSDPAAKVYADYTAKTCKEKCVSPPVSLRHGEQIANKRSSGFKYELRTVAKDDIEESILAANTDSAVNGIIVYYPIFSTRSQDQYIQSIVSVDKDVEGLSHQYIFNMYQNIRFLNAEQTLKSLLPCTPLAVIKILEFLHVYNPILPFGNRLHGHVITVINRSEVVGRPLAALLANDGATVYSVDINDVHEYTRGAGIKKRRHEVAEKAGWTMKEAMAVSDVVISGVPGDSFKVPYEYVKDGAVCVNFSSEKNFTPQVKERASIYVPAIGKVTIMILLRNLLVSLSLSFSSADTNDCSDSFRMDKQARLKRKITREKRQGAAR
jgi:methylenetetrahydrofolate dehydrogenase (NAD+)